MISSPVGFDLVSVIIDTFCVQIFGERSATYAIEAELWIDFIIMENGFLLDIKGKVKKDVGVGEARTCDPLDIR